MAIALGLRVAIHTIVTISGELKAKSLIPRRAIAA
jgi:hypothetical protein